MKSRIRRLAESWTFITAADRLLPPEEQTVFRLRPMSVSERLAATDDASRTAILEDGNRAVVTRERQVALALCLSHIVSIDRFPAEAPEPWPADRDARVRYLEGFDDETVREVGGEIYRRSVLGAPEKNSSPPEPT